MFFFHIILIFISYSPSKLELSVGKKLSRLFEAGFSTTRGSCHILADDKKIGWHPNFETLLRP
jgi:hypothetical protein